MHRQFRPPARPWQCSADLESHNTSRREPTFSNARTGAIVISNDSDLAFALRTNRVSFPCSERSIRHPAGVSFPTGVRDRPEFAWMSTGVATQSG